MGLLKVIRQFMTLTLAIVVLAVAGCSMFSSAPQKAAAPPAPNATAPVATETRDSSRSIDTIVQVQRKLADEGFYAGKADGVWGPSSESALRKYQMQHSLPVTGKLDADNLDAMGVHP